MANGKTETTKHSPFPWRFEGDQILCDSKSAMEEDVVCEPFGSTHEEAKANAWMIASVGDLFAITKKVSELINCNDGVVKTEGKCTEILAELILLCPEKILREATNGTN